MNRYRNHALAVASISLGLLVAVPARAASLQKVSNWSGGASLPSYVAMYIYVPDSKVANPPILVACHYCTGNASGYFGGLSGIKAGADKNGFIVVVPEATGRNCWDVGSSKSLTRDGGGDTQAIAQMVKYTISTYDADATRVYAMGGSSGAMMAQALMGVYPDVFTAAAARSGVPCGCWGDNYRDSDQWSDNCAGGRTTKSAEEWGNLVRAINPNYTGRRPRLQLFHGTADQTINYNNMTEAIKEWTNVLGLTTDPTSTDTQGNYSRQLWKNDCGYTVFEAWSQQGGSHSMPYEEDAILTFFGLDKAGGQDPELAACSGSGGASGTDGTGGSGATTATGGVGATSGGLGGSNVVTDSGGAQNSGGSSDGGGVVATGGATVGTGGSLAGGGAVAAGGGLVVGSGGSLSGGGAFATGGSPAVGTGGSLPSGGTDSGSGVALGAGGTLASGGSFALGGSGATGVGAAPGTAAATPGGNAGSGGSMGSEATDPASGCGCIVGRHAGHTAPTLTALLLAVLGVSFRRRR